MSQSLRDQLLGLGYEPAPKPERAPALRAEIRSAQEARGRDARGQDGRSKDARGKDERGKDERGRDGRDDSRDFRLRAAGTQQPSHQNLEGADPRKPDAPTPPQRSGRPPTSPRRTDSRPPGAGKSRPDFDLAKAYALRAQNEKDERIEAERFKQEEAKLRREAKARLAVLLKDQALNDPAAEIARHFHYGGKIKRIHVTPAQLTRLNAGELGVAQMDGRYLLITATLLDEAASIFPPAVALRVDPDAPAAEEPYGDPAYQVPDDLVW